MKMHEPKMILNLSLEDEELSKKVELAMNDYMEKLTLDKLENIVSKYIIKKINDILKPTYSWSQSSKIQGKSLEEFIVERVENKISEIIDRNIKEIMAKKLAQLI